MCVNERCLNRLLLSVRQFETSQTKGTQTILQQMRLQHRTGDKTARAFTRNTAVFWDVTLSVVVHENRRLTAASAITAPLRNRRHVPQRGDARQNNICWTTQSVSKFIHESGNHNAHSEAGYNVASSSSLMTATLLGNSVKYSPSNNN